MGEYLEHSSIEIIIESRLPVWILGKKNQALVVGTNENQPSRSRVTTHAVLKERGLFWPQSINPSQTIVKGSQTQGNILKVIKYEDLAHFATGIIGMMNVKSTR
uniref:NtA domain-containing protein n=1 Tax=Loa loa TaxID=7209 RepID=A0A1I7VF38_LOALO